MSRSRIVFVSAISIMLVSVVALALAGCSSQGKEPDVEPTDDIEVADGEGAVEIALDYAAGTGYEWQCSVDPEGVLCISSQDTVDKAEDEMIDGGPLQDLVTLRAMGAGKATLTCNLERSWEDVDPAEVQTFVFEVDDDLQITFLDDESDFVNAPVQVSNS